MDQFVDLITKVGLPVALVIYFVFRDSKREKETNTRFTGLEEFCRTDLKKLTEDSIKVNQQCADVIKADLKIIEKNSEKIEQTEKVLQECKMYLANRGGT